jgi:hypothetical protein
MLHVYRSFHISLHTIHYVRLQFDTNKYSAHCVVALLLSPCCMIDISSYLDGVKDGEIALNARQRSTGSFTLNQAVRASVFVPDEAVALSTMTVAVDLLGKKETKQSLTIEELSTSFKQQFLNQIFTGRQQFVMDFSGLKLDLYIEGFEHVSLTDGASAGSKAASSSLLRGQLLKVTTLKFRKSSTSSNNITFVGDSGTVERNDSLFRGDFNFEALGIGGLDEQFKKMFRTAFASRIYPGITKRLGKNHIRGILLYGPPGIECYDVKLTSTFLDIPIYLMFFIFHISGFFCTVFPTSRLRQDFDCASNRQGAECS